MFEFVLHELKRKEKGVRREWAKHKLPNFHFVQNGTFMRLYGLRKRLSFTIVLLVSFLGVDFDLLCTESAITNLFSAYIEQLKLNFMFHSCSAIYFSSTIFTVLLMLSLASGWNTLPILSMFYLSFILAVNFHFFCWIINRSSLQQFAFASAAISDFLIIFQIISKSKHSSSMYINMRYFSLMSELREYCTEENGSSSLNLFHTFERTTLWKI